MEEGITVIEAAVRSIHLGPFRENHLKGVSARDPFSGKVCWGRQVMLKAADKGVSEVNLLSPDHPKAEKRCCFCIDGL
jgi:hypothetical protein